MAIDVCSEIYSPRISFSHDLNQANQVVQVEDKQFVEKSLFDSTSDFNFCIVNNFKLELSSADELFSNGKLLPVQIKTNPTPKKETHQTFEHEIQIQPPVQLSCPEKTEKKRLKEFLSTSFEEEDEESEEKTQTKSTFWQFRRSSSLNFETSKGKSLIRSLQFLSRSNSTGSVAVNQKKETQKKNLQKQRSVSNRRSSLSSSSSSSSSSSCSTSYYGNNFSTQKPALRKSKSYGNGTRITPVLNIPPHYISKVTTSFSGFTSFFCNGKVKKKTKK